jgi:hypothetical protein
MAVPDYIKGYDLNLFFYLNGIPCVIGRATACSIKLTADIQETTTKNSIKGKTYDYTSKYTYTLSLTEYTNFVDIANLSVFQDMILTSGKLSFVFTDQTQIEWTGTVLLTESDTDSPFKSVSSSSLSFQGDGELTKVTTDIPPLPLPGGNVTIVDQFGAVIATVVAPGSYSVLRFDTIDCGHAVKPPSDLIIIAGQ